MGHDCLGGNRIIVDKRLNLCIEYLTYSCTSKKCLWEIPKAFFRLAKFSARVLILIEVFLYSLVNLAHKNILDLGLLIF